MVEWSPSALRDFGEIVEYIGADNPIAAIEQGDEIEQQVEILHSHPRIGRSGRVRQTRELVINRTPYIAVYRIRKDRIQVLRILHGAQQWPNSRL